MNQAIRSASILAARPRWLSALRWLGLILLMLLTMELAARIDDRVNHGAPIGRNYDFDQLFSFDGKVVSGIPNARYMKWSLNSVGLRGPEPDLSRPHRRVIVYGASEVFGIYETPGQEFPRQLETSLRSRLHADGLEVINAGIPGMRIGSGAEFLRQLGERLQPSVVVLYPTPTHYTGVTRPHCGRPERASALPEEEAPASRLKAKAIDRLKEVLPRPVLQQARQASIAWATRHAPAVEHISDESMKALEVDLRCAITAARSVGAQPMLVTHPNRFGATPQPGDDALLTGWRMQYPAYTESALLEIEQRSNALIRSVAASENLPLVDAHAAMAGHADYFADHAHFTDAGAKRMSQLLADAVTPLLAP
jgi:lysophospholipase L1-like esterase